MAAAALTRLMSSLLFGVTPLDVATFVAAATFLAGAALLASYVPASVNLLVLGQAHYVLDGNVARARSTFAELETWSRWLDTLRDSHQNVWPDGDFELLLEPTLCYLLAGDWHSLAKIARADIAPGVKVSSKRRPRLAFTLDLLRLLRLDSPPGRSVDPAPIAGRFHFAGYDELLRCIAAGDSIGFESQRAKLEAADPSRAKERESALDWSGSGKIAQAATFDAQGTTLCALAVKRGLAVAVDTRLYPGHSSRRRRN